MKTLLISFVMLIAILTTGPLKAQHEVPVGLNLPLTLTGSVLPGSTSVTLPFEVSGATGLQLDVAVPVNGAQLFLRDPAGVALFAPGDPTVQFISGLDLSGSATLPGGTFTLPEIPSPLNGTWTLVVQFPAAPERTVILATVLLRSAVQVGLVLERERYVTGEDIAIGLLVLSDGLPVTTAVNGPQISVARRGSATPPTVQTALDNGVDADGLAGDGVFSVDYTFPAAGTYDITADVEVAVAGALVRRSAARTVVVRDRGLVVLSAAATVLTGPAACGQGIQVTMDADVKVASTYVGATTLVGSNGQTTTVRLNQALTTGARLLSFVFGAEQLKKDIGVDGPYTIGQVQVLQSVDQTLSLTHRGEDLGETPAFALSGACLDPVELQASLTVTPTLSDGFIGSVTLTFPVLVNRAGTYTISFKVVGAAGQDIDLLGDSRSLSVGANNVSFTLPASRFLRADGPYSVISLLAIGPAGSASLGTLGATPAWSRWQFLPRINGDLDDDGDVDADDQAILLSSRNVPALSPGDRRDVVRDGVLDLRDARALTAMACAAGKCPLR